MVERFADQFQAVEVAYGRYNMRRIRALGAPGVQQPPLDKQPKPLGEEALHGCSRAQPRPKLTQDGTITSSISEVQAQRLCPINPPSHRLRRLAVGEMLRQWHDRHQS
jgi:hypothetical protein